MSELRNIYGERVPIIGGITSRNLFRDMWECPVDRGGLPNALWLITSLSLIVFGLWVMM